MAIPVWKNLHDEDFVPGLPAGDKFDVIDRLVQGLHARHLVPLAAITSALDGVIRQEREKASGMPGGWAAPHGRSDVIPSSSLIIGLSPVGVDFDAPDGSPSHVIVLALEGGQEHTSLVRAALLDLLGKHPDLAERLGKAETGFDARTMIRETEEAG
jgi:PTS system fructose-specific IIC component